MYIYIFFKKRKKYILTKIDEREKKTNNIISNQSKFDKISSKHGKQYIKKLFTMTMVKFALKNQLLLSIKK